MLVLARKLSESIVIGEGADQIVLTVVDIDRKRVRIGFTASKAVPINRLEVWQQIQEKKARKAKQQGEKP